MFELITGHSNPDRSNQSPYDPRRVYVDEFVDFLTTAQDDTNSLESIVIRLLNAVCSTFSLTLSIHIFFSPLHILPSLLPYYYSYSYSPLSPLLPPSPPLLLLLSNFLPFRIHPNALLSLLSSNSTITQSMLF